jgi:hypothetical protein
MPPYVIVECYVPCADAEVGKLTDRFRAFLYRLGFIENEPGFWDESMGWEEDGWYGPGCHRPSVVSGLVVGGRELEARPCLGGYELVNDSAPHGHWMCVELGFETEGEDQYLVSHSAFAQHGPVPTYVQGVGRALWRVMRAFAAEFPEWPVYCAFDGWEGEAWFALEGGKGELWSFDAAVAPHTFAERFAPLPDTYIAEAMPFGLALARRNVWISPPWRE